VVKRFTPNPILVIVEVAPKELGLPTEGYYAVDEIHDVKKLTHPLDYQYSAGDLMEY
jgi:hypothetical protein